MAFTPLLLLFRVRHPLLSTLSFLGRFRLVGCDAFKDSVSEWDGALSTIDTRTSTSPITMSVWVISCVS